LAPGLRRRKEPEEASSGKDHCRMRISRSRSTRPTTRYSLLSSLSEPQYPRIVFRAFLAGRRRFYIPLSSRPLLTFCIASTQLANDYQSASSLIF